MPRTPAVPAPYPWDWDRLLRESYPFYMQGDRRRPATPFATLVEALAGLDLVSIVDAPRARRLTEAWVRANDAALREAEDAQVLYALLRRYDAEVVRPAREGSETKGRRAAEALAASRAARIATRRAAAAATDPGPVATPQAGRAWAQSSALPKPLYHATRAGPAILRDGLLARQAVTDRERAAGVDRPGLGTLGGGPEHVVSLTADRAAAIRIAAALQALNEAHEDPEGVFAWFVEHWLPYLEQLVPAAGVQYRRPGRGPPSAQRVREMINEINSYSIMVKGAWPVALRIPWIMGTPRRTDPESIGVVTAYANIDQLYSNPMGSTGAGTWGRIVKRWTPGMDGLGNFIAACPSVRGGPRRPSRAALPRRIAVLEHAALAEATQNRSEAFEVRICPEDLTVVGFLPVVHWREVLMPAVKKQRRSGSKTEATVPIRLGYDVYNIFQRYWTGQWDPLYAVLSRRGPSVDWVTVKATPEEIARLDEVAEEILVSDDAEPGEVRTASSYLQRRGKMSRTVGSASALRRLSAQIKSPADLAKPLADPHLEQWRRCALAVYRRMVGAGETPSPAIVRRAFSICTRSLQDAGYLERGTRTPTAKGRAAAAQKRASSDAAEKRAAYQQMLRVGREGRPSRQERGVAKQAVRDLLAKVVPFRRPGIDLDALIAQTAPRPQRRRTRRRGAAARSVGSAKAERPAAVDTAVALQQAALDVFTCDTAFGTCDPKRPSQGHCLLASMAFQDIVGGDIRSGVVGDTPHYWNRLDGVEFDLTADQFGMRAPRWQKGTLYKPASRFLRCRGETLMDIGDNATVNRMYGLFVKRLAKALKEAGHADLAVALR